MQGCSLLLIFLITFTGAAVKGQTSRVASAASYIERGNDWVTNGKLDRAIADYDLAIATYPDRRGWLKATLTEPLQITRKRSKSAPHG
jgi:hypothetical protein